MTWLQVRGTAREQANLSVRTCLSAHSVSSSLIGTVSQALQCSKGRPMATPPLHARTCWHKATADELRGHSIYGTVTYRHLSAEMH